MINKIDNILYGRYFDSATLILNDNNNEDELKQEIGNVVNNLIKRMDDSTGLITKLSNNVYYENNYINNFVLKFKAGQEDFGKIMPSRYLRIEMVEINDK
jgi:hypothetical protein